MIPEKERKDIINRAKKEISSDPDISSDVYTLAIQILLNTHMLSLISKQLENLEVEKEPAPKKLQKRYPQQRRRKK